MCCSVYWRLWRWALSAGGTEGFRGAGGDAPCAVLYALRPWRVSSVCWMYGRDGGAGGDALFVNLYAGGVGGAGGDAQCAALYWRPWRVGFICSRCWRRRR